MTPTRTGRRPRAARTLRRYTATAVAAIPLALATSGCASTQNQAAGTQPPNQATAPTQTVPTPTLTATSPPTPTPTPSAPASSAAAPAAAPCRTSELTISLGPGGVAAGAWAALLEFTNAANAPCTMTGWPGVAGITSSGTASPATNRSDAMDGLNATGTPHVTLQPGGKAGIDISGTDNPAGGGSCPPPYRQLRVSAPGDSTSVTVSAVTSALSTGLPSCSPLAASPVHPLSDFSFSAQ